MKVIDLLKKRLDGEEMPKKIKYDYNIFIYDKEEDDYVYEDGDGSFFCDCLLYVSCLRDEIKNLNQEVEIIEEEPEIDIQELEEIKPQISCGGQYIISNSEQAINKLIKAVKQLDNKIKEKE